MTTNANTSTTPMSRRARTALLVGFLALTIGVLAAYRAPARGTELSIYRSTPLLFWGGAGMALLVGLVVAFRAGGRGRVGQGAHLLAGASVFAIVCLPLVRGYHFYGAGDSLSHLGWVRMFDAGTLHPVEMRYPAIHSVSAILTNATALEDRTALLLTVVAFFAVFLVFVPLCVRAITDSGPALLAGVASALLLLPINNIGVHVVPFPTTQAIMFSPVVVYLTLGYVLDRGDRYTILGVSGVGLLLGVSALAVTLLHPQQAMNLLLAFVLIALLQWAYRAFRSGSHPIAEHRPLYAQTGLFTVVYVLWAAPKDRVQQAVLDIGTGLVASSGAGTTVSQRTVGLVELGGSLEEMFVKLFGVSVVYVVLATVLGLAVLAGAVGRVDRDGTAFLQYLIAAVPPAAGLFLVFLLADAKDQFFRYQGFLMMIVTIFGAVALAIAIDRLGELRARPVLSTVLALVFVVFLIVQLVAFHPSPYIYQPNSQVVGTEVSGYNTVMEDRDEEIAFAGIRSGPRRYADAYYGPDSETAQEFPGRRNAVPEPAFNDDITEPYDRQIYVPVTESDYQRETELFEGFRYSEAGFERLEQHPDVDRVHSNGAFELYLLDPDGG